MKRYSEVVLNGHPDKFCDLLADRIIRYAYEIDRNAYAQIEISIWSDNIFLTGSVVTINIFKIKLHKIILELGLEIGYSGRNFIDIKKYKIIDKICWITEPPKKWTDFVNDQSIVIGYAGYDTKTNYLPPEHFVAWYFREEITKEFSGKIINGLGPDGKILIVIDENENQWRIKKILLTLQQLEKLSFLDFIDSCTHILQKIYNQLQIHDKRWIGEWEEINILINPNGPLTNGGSYGDNGQTGRKLIMDFYGPRIPIGGGAIYGKHITHIDRIGAINARKYAIDLVEFGATEVQISICYAPNINTPLEVYLNSSVKPAIDLYEYFNFKEMYNRTNTNLLNYNLFKLGTFYNSELSFNKPEIKSKNILTNKSEYNLK